MILSRAENTKSKITKETFKQLKIMPLKQLTIKDICIACHISRMTFYRNFKSKNDIILFKFDQIFTVFINRLLETKARSFADIMTVFFKIIKSERAVMDIVINNNLTEMLKERLKYYIWELRDNNIVNFSLHSSSMLISFVSAGLTDVIIDWTKTDMKRPIPELVIFTLKLKKLVR